MSDKCRHQLMLHELGVPTEDEKKSVFNYCPICGINLKTTIEEVRAANRTVDGFYINFMTQDQLVVLAYNLDQKSKKRLRRIEELNTRLCNIYMNHSDVITREEVGYIDGFIF